MIYASPLDMLDRFGATELAQIATPEEFQVLGNAQLNAGIVADDLSPFTEDEQTAINATITRLETALNDADNDLSFYLADRYALPFVNTPPTLKKLACNIARYQLYKTDATEEVKMRYKDSIRTLEMINAGKIRLGIDDSQQAKVISPDLPASNAPERVFTRHSLRDY